MNFHVFLKFNNLSHLDEIFILIFKTINMPDENTDKKLIGVNF